MLIRGNQALYWVSLESTQETPSLCKVSLYKHNKTETTKGDPRQPNTINRPIPTYSSIHSVPQRYYNAKEVSTASRYTLRFDSLRKHLDRTVAKALITDPTHSIFADHDPAIASAITTRKPISQQ